MSKHTRGPWEIVENSWSTTTIRSGDTTIAVLSCEEDSTEDNQFELEAIQKANAKLIAAAPELLQLAKDLLEQVKDEWPGCALVERANQLLAQFE
jgi:hypothetical protein